MTKEAKAPNKDEAKIYASLVQMANQFFPGTDPKMIDISVKKLMSDNPDASLDDFHKMAQMFAKSVKDGSFHKQLAVTKLKNKLSYGK